MKPDPISLILPKSEVQRSYYVVAVVINDGVAKNQGRVRKYWRWLGLSEGYMSHTSWISGAQRFETIPTIEHIRRYSGWPWYDRHDKRYKPRVFKVNVVDGYALTEC